MPTRSAPRSSLISPEAAARLSDAPGTLALIGFGGARDAGDGRSPWIGTGLETLGAPLVQAWQVSAPVEYGRLGDFTTRSAPGLAMIATTRPDSKDPVMAAERLYRELFEIAERLGCPHLLRIWQYLPRITEPWGEEDRYRAFCAGRRRAFEADGHSDAALPAACLLGDASERMILYALIADTAGRQIENPRQESAFLYPPRYGRKPPSFSRATAACWGDDGEHLYISGTSSIAGHASRHEATLDQLEETLANLEALLAHWKDRKVSLAAIAPLKVYLRRASDLEAVRAALAKRLPAGHPVAYQRADVCRPELNVEIEGLVQSAASAPPA